MQASYPAAIKNVLAHEGGYTNHPADPGGPTNWGITIFDARKYWKTSASAADVKVMPLSVAQDIYDKHYWDPQRCDDLPAGLDYSMFDYGVNSGIGRSGKVLRRLLGLSDKTSAITQEVIDAVNKRDVVALIKALNDERLRFLKGLKTWPTFRGGWGRRVSEVRTLSIAMAMGTGNIGNARSVTPTNDNEVMAKGLAGSQVKHEAAKGSVAKGGAVVSVSGGGLGAWLGAHPGYAALGVGVGVVCTIAAVELIERRFKAKQEAPTPGMVPVPVAAAA
jgi:lysozyme family protein